MRGATPDLVVNTSCEHIADRRGLARPPAARNPVLLQSNDYFGEPTHVNCVRLAGRNSLALAGLSRLAFSGELPPKNYTRFMLIGAV